MVGAPYIMSQRSKGKIEHSTVISLEVCPRWPKDMAPIRPHLLNVHATLNNTSLKDGPHGWEVALIWTTAEGKLWLEKEATAYHHTLEHSDQHPCGLSPNAALHGTPTKRFCVKKNFLNEHRVGILYPIYTETLLFKDELFLKLHLSNCLAPDSWLLAPGTVVTRAKTKCPHCYDWITVSRGTLAHK